MDGIERILCATDFSSHARRALERAVWIATWFSSELTVLHVSPPPLSPELSVLVRGSQARDRLLASLARFSEPAERAGLGVRRILDEGSAAERILAVARDVEAGLLVVGTHGASGFRRFTLGSVSEKVLRRAECPVLAVPPRPAAASRADGPFMTILCPVDLGDASIGALDHAVSMALQTGSRLVILHVVETAADEEPPLMVDLEADLHERLQGLVEPEATNRLDVDTVVVCGRPADEILRIAEARDAGFIVMGVQGRRALDLRIFGSTTSQVTRAAACPVMTVRARARVPHALEKEAAAEAVC